VVGKDLICSILSSYWSTCYGNWGILCSGNIFTRINFCKFCPIMDTRQLNHTHYLFYGERKGEKSFQDSSF